MQGFIASLLALMMTGMVVSQQPQNNFQTSQANSPQLLGRYLLIVDDNVTQTLKMHGYRTAHILPSDRENVDHIVFHSSENNVERLRDVEPFSIQPVPPIDGDETIVFELNDHYLDLMNRKGLRYILRQQDVGRFNALTIKYDGPIQSRQTAGTQPVDTRTFQNQQLIPSNPRQAAADRTVNQLDPRIARNVRNATPDTNETFYGPSLPDNWERRQPQQLNPQTATNGGSFRPNLGTIATRRDDPRGLENTQQDRYSTDIRSNLLPDNREQDRQLYDNQLYANQRFDRQLDQPGRDNRIAANTPFDSTPFRPDTQLPRVDLRPIQTLQQTATYDPALQQELAMRDAKNRSLDRVNQSLADQNEALLRRLEDERLANRRERVDYAERTDPRATAYDREYDYAPRRQRSTYNDQVIVQPPLNTGDSMPDRVALVPRPTNRLLPFAIEGPTGNTAAQSNSRTITNSADPNIVAEAERFKKQNAALWFIMLCSVGLNFYLSWIARGFYVRNEELADDIRESFTSSM